jgi:hypothetical protein
MKAVLIGLATVYVWMFWVWRVELWTSVFLLMRWRGDPSEHAQRMRREHRSRLINFVLLPLHPVNWPIFLAGFLFARWMLR